jgi:membrane-associated phospholipid phosphatase
MNRRALVLAGMLGAALVALGIAAATFGVLPGDRAVRDWLIGHAPPAFVAFLRGVNWVGDWRVGFPATPLLLVSPRIRRRWWIWIPAVLGAPWLADHVLKYVVGRARPEAASFGFPSGHTTGAAAYMGAVIVAARDLPWPERLPLVVVAGALIVLVGLARIVLHAHWPSDVAGGLLLGLGAVFAASAIAEWTPLRDAAARRSLLKGNHLEQPGGGWG